MPDRIIRDQCRSSPTLRSLTDAAERAWWRLTCACDDYGRFDADPEVLLSELFKRKPQDWAVDRMEGVIKEWEAVGLIHRYRANGHQDRIYGHILTFRDYQRDRDSKPKFPEPPCCGDSPQVAAGCGDSPQVAADGGDSPLARARSESREARVERRESKPGGDMPRAAATTRPIRPVPKPEPTIRTSSLSKPARRRSVSGGQPSLSEHRPSAADPRVDQIFARWRDAFARYCSGRQPHIKPRDRGVVVGLLRDHPFEEICELIDVFFARTPKWVRDQDAYDLPVFERVYNQLLMIADRGGATV